MCDARVPDATCTLRGAGALRALCVQAIQLIIDIGHHCVLLRNYNAVCAIVTCLSAHYIR
jgi:hypothetical protein